MEKKKDMLYFLGRLDFIEKTNGDLVEEMRCTKRQLVIEFGDYNIATMIFALDIIDKMIVLNTTNELNALSEKNNSLREKISYSIIFKHFVGTSNEHVIEH